MMHENGYRLGKTTKAHSRRFRRAHAWKGALIASALATGLTAAACSDDDPATPPSPPPQTEAGVDSGAPPRHWSNLGFKDELYNEITLFYLGQTWHQAADVGEVLETASRIDETDPKSWAREWRKTAERLGAVAQESERTNHPLTASHAYLRSATYYRAALHHHVEPESPEVRELAQREVDSFAKHLSLSKSPCQPIRVPYEGTTLPGYFCKSSAAAATRAPVLLYQQGRDGWAEDALFIAGEAMKRGYHVLMFDGPGQGQTIRLQGLPFRPDWDKVVTPIVDYAIARADVDPTRIGLMALSMGGYLGPRAATKEHRLKVLIANPGVIDWNANVEGALKQIDPALVTLVDTDEAAFNARLEELMNGNALWHWAMIDFMWHHKVDTPAKLIKDLRRYIMTPEEVGTITANTLVVDAESETRGQAQVLFDAITAKKTYLKFTAAETAQFHDQPGAEAIAQHRILEWLEGAL